MRKPKWLRLKRLAFVSCVATWLGAAPAHADFRLLQSRGDGTWDMFGVEAPLTVASLRPSFVHGDFNNDEIVDLADLSEWCLDPRCSSFGLIVNTSLSRGTRNWTRVRAPVGWGSAVRKQPTLAGDYDGDGKTDLAFPFQDTRSPGGLTIRLLLSNGDGSWRQPEARIKWGAAVQAYPTLVGDYDGDGKADLAFPFQDTRSPGGLTVRLLLSNGDGTWRQPEARIKWGAGVQKYPTLVGDYDGDGKADLAFPFQDTRSPGGLTVRLLLSNGDGTWRQPEAQIKWGAGVQKYPTLVGDYDGDGKADLAFPFQDTRSPGGLTVRLLLSNGNGTWRQPEARIKWGAAVQEYPTLVGDYNGDGKADLAFPFQDTRDPGGLTVRSLFSNGDGSWQQPEMRIKWGPATQNGIPTFVGNVDLQPSSTNVTRPAQRTAAAAARDTARSTLPRENLAVPAGQAARSSQSRVVAASLAPSAGRPKADLFFPYYPPPPTPPCKDKAQNGSETDVDCGGSCSACGIGKKCSSGADCASGNCAGGACARRLTCDNSTPALATATSVGIFVADAAGCGGVVYFYANDLSEAKACAERAGYNAVSQMCGFVLEIEPGWESTTYAPTDTDAVNCQKVNTCSNCNIRVVQSLGCASQ